MNSNIQEKCTSTVKKPIETGGIMDKISGTCVGGGWVIFAQTAGFFQGKKLHNLQKIGLNPEIIFKKWMKTSYCQTNFLCFGM